MHCSMGTGTLLWTFVSELTGVTNTLGIICGSDKNPGGKTDQKIDRLSLALLDAHRDTSIWVTALFALAQLPKEYDIFFFFFFFFLTQQ